MSTVMKKIGIAGTLVMGLAAGNASAQNISAISTHDADPAKAAQCDASCVIKPVQDKGGFTIQVKGVSAEDMARIQLAGLNGNLQDLVEIVGPDGASISRAEKLNVMTLTFDGTDTSMVYRQVYKGVQGINDGTGPITVKLNGPEWKAYQAGKAVHGVTFSQEGCAADAKITTGTVPYHSPVVITAPEPVQEVVAPTPEPIAEPVVIVTPPVVEPIVEAAPAAALMGAPRVVTGDAGAAVQGTETVGVSSMATHYVTGQQGWDGRAIGAVSNNDSVVAVDTVYTNDTGKFQARLGVGAANIDGNTTDAMFRAQASYSFIGNVNTMANGGWLLGVQGGVDPLAGAGDTLDNYMVNGATAPDPATRSVMQQAIATNPLAVGLFGGWASDKGKVQVSGRAAYLDPSVNDRMGSSDKVAVEDAYYNAGTNKWTDGWHASVEAALNGSNWRGVAGATYDRFNYDKNRSAELCGPCGFDYQLTGGPQTNTTGYLGLDVSPTDKLNLSARVNHTTVENAGGAEVTGFIIDGVRADLGEYSLKGVDLKGTHGTVEGQYALSDDWSMVAGASAGKWNMTKFDTKYDVDGYSFSIGARYEFGQSAAGAQNRYFLEGRIGYEAQETTGFDFKKEDKGATIGLQAGLRW